MSEDFFEKVGTQPAPVTLAKAMRSVARHPDQADISESDFEVEAKVKKSDLQGGTSWAGSGDNYWRIGQSHKRLPAGVYRCQVLQSVGPVLARMRNNTDTLVKFPDSESQRIVDEIRAFQGMKGAFQEHGFLHKRGVLMWGPPGSGKTTTLQLLIDLIVNEHGGLAIFVDHPGAATACLQMLRAVEPKRQLVGILEDIDALVERYGESEYLALLDGETQVDNVVYVATTNYPERLDKRFVDRPSRFDTIRYIGMPNAEARAAYFTAKVPNLTADEKEEYVDASEHYSVAHMRELIILTRCFGVSLKEAKARLDKTRTVKPSSTQEPGAPKFGFLGS